jgi:hypothetical protein
MARRGRTLLAIATLVAANLLLDFYLWRWLQWWEFGLFIGLGVPLTQIVLLAAWLSLGDSHWYWRLAVAMPLAMSVGLAAKNGSSNAPVGLMLAPVALTVLLFAMTALFVPLRRVRGWRLTTERRADAAMLGRFQIGDLMLWTLVLSLPLGITRLALPTGDDVATATIYGIAVGLVLAPLFVPALLLPFAPLDRRAVWPAAGLIIYSSGLTAVGTYWLYHQMLLAFGPPAWILLLRSISAVGAFGFGVPLALFVNGLVLRMLGWRLVRPAWKTDMMQPSSIGVCENRASEQPTLA